MKILAMLRVTPVSASVGVLIQFSLPLPEYTVKRNGKLTRNAAKIEKLLLKRKDMFGLDCEITMLRRVVWMGKEIWERIV